MAVVAIDDQLGAMQLTLGADIPVGALSAGPPPRGPYQFKVKPGSTKVDVDNAKGTYKLALTFNFRKVNADGTPGDDVNYDAYAYEELPIAPAPLPAGADAAMIAAYNEKVERFQNRQKYFKRFLGSILGKTAEEAAKIAFAGASLAQIRNLIEAAPGGLLSFIPGKAGATGLEASSTFAYILADERAQALKADGTTGEDGQPNYALQARPPKAKTTTANQGLSGLGSTIPGAAGGLPGGLPGLPGAGGAVGGLPTIPGAVVAGVAAAAAPSGTDALASLMGM